MADFKLHYYPVCPFSQRVEILLALKRRTADVQRCPADISQPLPEALLAKTGGSNALPVLELPDGRILKESLVIMQYLDDCWPETRVAQMDPYRHAVEGMLISMAGDFCTHGYQLVMNQDAAQRERLHAGMLEQYGRLDRFLAQHAPRGPFLFEEFGWTEVVYTPFFERFWFLEYYEGFQLPETALPRLRDWVAACVSHPDAQQVTKEEIIKLYYDYARGVGNGGLPPGRKRSSFVLTPHWRDRPWPPRDKYAPGASDAELGLV